MNFPHRLLVNSFEFDDLIVNDINSFSADQIRNSETGLFIIPLDQVRQEFSSSRSRLAKSEFDQLRIQSYLKLEDKDRYIAVQNCIYAVLEKLGLERFWARTGYSGRPYLNCEGVEISVSHDIDNLVVALSYGGRIGVDTESTRSTWLLDVIGRRYGFDDGSGEILSPLKNWTLRESILKAFNLTMSEIIGGLSIQAIDNKIQISSVRRLFGHWSVAWLPFSDSTICILREQPFGPNT